MLLQMAQLQCIKHYVLEERLKSIITVTISLLDMMAISILTHAIEIHAIQASSCFLTLVCN